jgi:hypothetical protein
MNPESKTRYIKESLERDGRYEQRILKAEQNGDAEKLIPLMEARADNAEFWQDVLDEPVKPAKENE